MSDSIDWAAISKAIQNWVVAGSGLASDKVWWAYEGRPRPPAPYIALNVQSTRGLGHDWITSDFNLLTFSPLTVTAVNPAANTLTIPSHGLGNGDGPIQLFTSGTMPAPLVQATDYWVIVVDANTIQLAATFVQTGGQMPLGAGNPVTPIDITTAGAGTLQLESTDDTLPAGKELVRTAQGFREMVIHFECFGVEGTGYDAMRILTNVVASLQLHIYELDQAGVGISDLGQGFSQGAVQHLEGHRGSILEPRAMWDMTIYLASALQGFETIIETIGTITMPEPEGP